MIRGIGVDSVEIDRIAAAIERHGERFLARIFTDDERGYCDRCERPVLRYAARFAAKEAFAKALGVGIGGVVGWRDVAVGKEVSGAPFLVMSSAGAAACEERGIRRWHLSLSHTNIGAVAFVVLED